MFQACDLLENAAYAFSQLVSAYLRLMGKLLQLSFDHGKRRAKLMGCICEKLGATSVPNRRAARACC